MAVDRRWWFTLAGAVVLVTGCGPIGLFAVGIAKAAGASMIIASDVNEKRLALARQMGAKVAAHPKDIGDAVRKATDNLGVDVVLEMSGVPAAIHQAFELVPVGQSCLGQLVQQARRLVRVEDDLAAVLAVADLRLLGGAGQLGGRA